MLRYVAKIAWKRDRLVGCPKNDTRPLSRKFTKKQPRLHKCQMAANVRAVDFVGSNRAPSPHGHCAQRLIVVALRSSSFPKRQAHFRVKLVRIDKILDLSRYQQSLDWICMPHVPHYLDGQRFQPRNKSVTSM